MAAFSRSYLLGLLALNTGDTRSALRHLEDAIGTAERLGLTGHRHMAEQVFGRLLQEVGRTTEASHLFARLRREIGGDLSACRKGQLLNNIAWRLLLAREGGSSADPAEDPEPLLDEARQLFEEEACPESDDCSGSRGSSSGPTAFRA